MNKGEFLSVILRSQKTVFSTKEIGLLWRETNSDRLKSRLSYYVAEGKLSRVRRGLYVKDTNYNHFELANKIFIPSYISFETVLTRTGLVFQYYGLISSAAYLSREVEIDGQNYSYTKIRNEILTNTSGVIIKDGVSVATTERAMLDTIYAHKDYHFDSLDAVDWNKVRSLLPIYGNKRMEKLVESMYHN